MRKSKGDLKISFQRVDPAARHKRETARHTSSKTGATAIVSERTLESLWHDKMPDGWNFLDWHRAWNNGEPTEEHIELYNSLWPKSTERHMMLSDEDDDE